MRRCCQDVVSIRRPRRRASGVARARVGGGRSGIVVLEQFKLSAQVLFCRGAELVLAEKARINKRSKTEEASVDGCTRDFSE